MEYWKKIKLRLNHIVFWWYYKRVPKFFHQWPLLKSIEYLKQNYEHQEFVIKGNEAVISNAIKEEQRMKKEIINLRLQMTATDEQIDWANRVFGLDLRKKSEN